MSTKPEADSVSVLIGLGGNIGDVIASMQGALDAFNSRGDCNVVAVSNVYKTPPWGIEDQDWFHNACAEVLTMLEADPLLDLVLSIEANAGRIRNQRWGPRTLDLDILVYGNEHIETERLEVPHPRMFERAFVVQPLNDIASDRVVFGKPIADYALEVTDETMKNLGPKLFA